MTKTKVFATGYISFWRDATTDSWHPMILTTPPTNVGGSQKYYKISIPVPDDLLVDELPDQAGIKVEE